MKPRQLSLQLTRTGGTKQHEYHYHFRVVAGKSTLSHPDIHDAIVAARLEEGSRVGQMNLYEYPDDDGRPDGPTHLWFHTFYPWNHGNRWKKTLPLSQKSFGAQTLLGLIRELKRKHGSAKIIRFAGRSDEGKAFWGRLRVNTKEGETLGSLEAKVRAYLSSRKSRYSGK